MRTVNGLTLYEVDDIDQLGVSSANDLPAATRTDLLAVEKLTHWIRGFLACPHAHLGRSGKVCPFIPDALRRQSLYFAVQPEAQAVDEVSAAIACYQASFRSLAAAAGEHRVLVALMVLFPSVVDYGVIDKVQEQQKLDYVREGMMLGQFHPECNEPGIRNPAFLPLRAPLPLLAIRHMVPSDIVFLGSRADYLTGFQRFVDPALLPPELMPKYIDACRRWAVCPVTSVKGGESNA